VTVSARLDWLRTPHARAARVIAFMELSRTLSRPDRRCGSAQPPGGSCIRYMSGWASGPYGEWAECHGQCKVR
jgi:hypothetical protein